MANDGSASLVPERRLLQPVQPLQRPGCRCARSAWAPTHRDVDRAGGRVGMYVEDVLVALLAPGAHEHPAAALRGDLAGDGGGRTVHIVPRCDLAVPDHFEPRDG